jgi:uncharacterized membrane protein
MMISITDVELEHWTLALSGTLLTVYGVRRRSLAGALVAAGGGALIYRAATENRRVSELAGIRRSASTKRALSGSGGINVEESVTINRPPIELYTLWRDLEQLPSFMPHLVSVRQIDSRRSHWVAKVPAGRTVEWHADIINDIPSELIAWRTLAGSDVVSAGSVHFKAAPGGRGTEVRVRLQYDLPGGKLGAMAAWMFGDEPSQTILEDLRRLKQLMEAGEAPTTVGQPRGGRR